MSVRVLLLFMMGSWTTALHLEAARRISRNTGCKLCRQGEYMENCNSCSKCPYGTYTSHENHENRCHSCYKNCIADLHMQVVKECSNVSDVVCHCMDGYVCTNNDILSGHCTQCDPVPVQTPHTTHSPALKSTAGMQVIWVLCGVLLVGVGYIIFIIQFLCRRKGCLKKLMKQCPRNNQKVVTSTVCSHINEQFKEVQTEEGHPHTPTSTCNISESPLPASTEQSLPTGKLGPLHIYGAGTVFVSLLNQFGLNGGDKDEDDHHQSLNETQLHGPTSPLPLSEEEKSRDNGYVSFPSQEQGKECHMSKEEGLC